ncbi:hypothetical protein K491DRAFT_674674 [Lophiostoma macrostomum CBS 122681]|uniref:Uncharacterized protein n=1 Tax=Lophiostoma macrostomum CBS 122681 TaxID=1314788 RepID=A0A6A6TLV5_9PLEO|nr:hypothetical protein K491DRAFT_674674 [Lophiostoma macrostomum CBS 122681]
MFQRGCFVLGLMHQIQVTRNASVRRSLPHQFVRNLNFGAGSTFVVDETTHAKMATGVDGTSLTSGATIGVSIFTIIESESLSFRPPTSALTYSTIAPTGSNGTAQSPNSTTTVSRAQITVDGTDGTSESNISEEALPWIVLGSISGVVVVSIIAFFLGACVIRQQRRNRAISNTESLESQKYKTGLDAMTTAPNELAPTRGSVELDSKPLVLDIMNMTTEQSGFIFNPRPIRCEMEGDELKQESGVYRQVAKVPAFPTYLGRQVFGYYI